ncbi:mite allergen Eur m 3-like isoform X2 [Homalodisca vitripennis]|uniref:mite allergen Eur m 3-like isoform X2 n=1 Tax=Homalodisca vitripennis TaxID=197043 RepID=UPI001EEBF53C|nr:mite allergen Eur m 3-like isoform X2 [Homalodisca vitripennis]
MKLLILYFCLLVVHLCLTSGLEIGKHAEGQKRIHGNLGIINGKKASIKKFPYMVALIIDGSLQGSGVILNSHWILTTAFNVAWVPSDEIEFRAGSTTYEQGGQTLTAEKVVVHENYTGSWDYDIAVVKLNKPIKLGKKAKPISAKKISKEKLRWLLPAGALHLSMETLHQTYCRAS